LGETKGQKRPARLQTWVYLTEAGIGLIVLERTRQGIVHVLKSLWRVEEKPLEQPAALADWVAEHCRGQLNLLLDDSAYQMMLVDVPDVPAAEVESALHFKAADLISYDLDDASIELISLPAEAYRGRLRMAFVIAAQKPPLIAWAMAMGERGHRIECIDIDQLTLRNTAIRALDRDQGGLLFFEADRCRLILLFEQEIVLSRQFDIGFTDLGIATSGEAELVLEGSLDIQLDSLSLEIRRSFDYYEAQLGLGSINDIAVLGWPGDPDITDSLGAKLECRFRLAHPGDFILSPTDADWPAQLIPALGTAFRETAT
jgi:MSHA biogenesis protein MshI